MNIAHELALIKTCAVLVSSAYYWLSTWFSLTIENYDKLRSTTIEDDVIIGNMEGENHYLLCVGDKKLRVSMLKDDVFTGNKEK